MPIQIPPYLTSAQTKSTYAVSRLRENFPAAVSIDDVVNYAFGKMEQDDRTIDTFKKIMERSNEVAVNKKDRTYCYKPPYDIRSSDQLIAHFQKQTDTTFITVSDLKKGWGDCEAVIDKMELQNRLIVIRHKKDNAPRVIWADDASLHAPLDQEFKDLWASIPLSSKDDVVRYLKQSGRITAGQIAENKATAQTKAKVRKSRQSTKQTNKHMVGLFKDYSGMRQKGK